MNYIPVNECSITDEEVFAAFDLTRPGLSAVSSALARKDIAAAKKALIDYFESRTSPRYFFDYRELPLKKIDTDTIPYHFQASLGLSGSLKDFCLYAGRKLMEHIYVRPGRNHVELDLGHEYENLPHFNFYKDQGKKHRTILDIFSRGQFFEYLYVLYHETGDKQVLAQFKEMLQVFWRNYPLYIEYSKSDASHFMLTEERDVMSTGWLTFQYISLFYTRIPYEIDPELSFEIIKRIWFQGIQFRRFDSDTYRKYNHHMWERGLVPFILGTLLPEIPDFAAMKERGASIICRHIKDDFNEFGGYSEHSIPYWSGAALGEMIHAGVYLARLNHQALLDAESERRIDLSLNLLALISPPGDFYPSLGDNGGPMVTPVLNMGVKTTGNLYCKEVLALRRGEDGTMPLDFSNDKCGFLCARSSYRKDASYLLMSAKRDCGDSGHNHMDMLSLFLTFGGEEFIGEPHARQIYHTALMGSDQRGYLYNMESHNTVLAYGKPVQPNRNYASKWGVYRPDSPITAFYSDEEGMYASAFHDAYTYCRHKREILFHRKKGLLIRDNIEHGDRLPDCHIQRWHLFPDVVINELTDRSVLLEKNGVKVLCLWTGNPSLQIWQRKDLLPKIVSRREELSTIIDASFPSGAAGNGNSISSQTVLMLDVTSGIPDNEEQEQLLAWAGGISELSDASKILNEFATI